LDSGIGEDQIVGLALDEFDNAQYRNPLKLNKVVKERMPDKSNRYYVFIDEIQFVTEIQNPYVDDPNEKLTFVDIVLGWMKIPNADIYVTGSNSKMLSSDVLTQFRDRGDEIRVNPLSFAEVYEHYEGERRNAWRDYYTYGGMPMVWSMGTHEERSRYLHDLFARTYIKDVLERHQIKNNVESLEILLNVLASGIGSLTNPSRLSNTFASERHIRIAPATIDTYIGYFLEAFLMQKAERYDVKGRKYIKTKTGLHRIAQLSCEDLPAVEVYDCREISHATLQPYMCYAGCPCLVFKRYGLVLQQIREPHELALGRPRF